MKYLYINKYWEINKEYDIDKLLYLMIDRPNEIIISCRFIWKNDKKQNHRNYDLPSNVFYFSEMYELHWYVNNKRHRDNNKPAIIWKGENKKYYLHDKLIKVENC